MVNFGFLDMVFGVVCGAGIWNVVAWHGIGFLDYGVECGGMRYGMRTVEYGG